MGGGAQDGHTCLHIAAHMAGAQSDPNYYMFNGREFEKVRECARLLLCCNDNVMRISLKGEHTEAC